MGFVLDAIDTGQSCRIGVFSQLVCGKPSDGVYIKRWAASVFMGQGNFEAVRETRKINFQVRVLPSQMLEGFQARLDDRGL